MKKLYILLVVMMMLSASLVAADPVLKATLLRQEPLPAQPGQLVTVYVELENDGTEDARDTVIEFVEEFPFTLAGGSDAREEIGNLKSQQSFVTEFDVIISSSAPVGNNVLTVRYTADEAGDDWTERELKVRVNTNDASLAITEVNINPEEIVPGEAGQVTLTVKNNADIVLRDIALQLELETTSGTTTTDLPFIPTNSVTEKRINRLNVGETTQITFDIKAYPSADPGYYKLPLDMSYFDDQGTETTSEDFVGVIVEAQPELKILLSETTLSESGGAGKVTLQFINKGIHDLKFLDVELLESEEYSIQSSSASYIGDLDSDDYRTEEFTITPKSKDATLQIKTNYKDDNNKEYEVTTEVPIRYASSVQNTGRSGSPIIIILVIVAIGLIIYFRRKNKQKRRK